MADQHLKRKTGGRGVGKGRWPRPVRPTGAGARSGQNAYARRVRPDKESSCCWRRPVRPTEANARSGQNAYTRRAQPDNGKQLPLPRAP